MSLLNIHSGGIKGYCSDLILDENNRIHFLSVAGFQTAVKGIIAQCAGVWSRIINEG